MGDQKRKKKGGSFSLLHHLRPLWHECLMKQEIFSRWKVMSICVWGRCVCVCVPVCADVCMSNLLPLNQNPTCWGCWMIHVLKNGASWSSHNTLSLAPHYLLHSAKGSPTVNSRGKNSSAASSAMGRGSRPCSACHSSQRCEVCFQGGGSVCCRQHFTPLVSSYVLKWLNSCGRGSGLWPSFRYGYWPQFFSLPIPLVLYSWVLLWKKNSICDKTLSILNVGF